MIIASGVHLVFSVLRHTSNENTWTIALTAILTGVGLIFAGDASATPPPPTDPPKP